MDLEFRGIRVFVEVAQNGSFTAAAHNLMVSPAAISQMIRQLEERLGVKLLTRTTRKVGLTEAGAAFLAKCKPALEMIGEGAAQASSLQVNPSGLLRITSSRLAAHLYLESYVKEFLEQYPLVTVEIYIDDELTDVVGEKFDLGIRTAGFVEQDMIAANLKPMRLLICAAPKYFRSRARPKSLEDLKAHNCIRYRGQSGNRLLNWEVQKNGKELELEVNGNIIVNETQIMKALAIKGIGLAQIVEDDALQEIKNKDLEIVLEKFAVTFDGFQLFYPNRQFLPMKVRAFADFLTSRVR